MATLPDEIEVVEESPFAIRYLFPRREWGRGRWLAWGMIALGAAFGYWMLRQPIMAVAANGPGANLLPLAFWSWVTCTILWFTLRYPLALLFGRREVKLDGHWLRAGERVGGWRWSNSWKLEQLKSIQIVDLWPLTSRGTATASCKRA